MYPRAFSIAIAILEPSDLNMYKFTLPLLAVMLYTLGQVIAQDQDWLCECNMNGVFDKFNSLTSSCCDSNPDPRSIYPVSATKMYCCLEGNSGPNDDVGSPYKQARYELICL
ncbi:hypothetical protein C8R45DRAFT_1104942 [Mycena sanguinolenta]|nr:hypothetical protein C8R45DRAFT_1104942 [Mycena sanguinolenta]